MGWWLLEREGGRLRENWMARGVFGSYQTEYARINTHINFVSSVRTNFFFTKLNNNCWTVGNVMDSFWMDYDAIISYRIGMILAKMRWNVGIRTNGYYFDCLLKSMHFCFSFDGMRNGKREIERELGILLATDCRFLLHSYHDNNKKKIWMNRRKFILLELHLRICKHKRKLYAERIRLLWCLSHISFGFISKKNRIFLVHFEIISSLLASLTGCQMRWCAWLQTENKLLF